MFQRVQTIFAAGGYRVLACRLW